MRTALLAGLALLAFTGCSDEPPSIPPLSKNELAKIPAVRPEQLASFIDSQKGKVVVLAVWSVRRDACLAMYPELGTLCSGGADEPVVVAVSIDRVDDVRAKILPLIKKHRPKFLNRVVPGGHDAVAGLMGKNWSGQVPAIALRDRDGEPAGFFYGQTALAKARRRLDQLLGGAPR